MTLIPACQPQTAGLFDTLKTSFTDALRAVKHALSMFCIDRKYALWRLNRLSMEACSVLVNWALLTGCPGVWLRMYIAVTPGSVGRQSSWMVRSAYNSRAITIPFQSCWTLWGHVRRCRACSKCRRKVRMRSKLGRGYSVGMLTPTSAATSSYEMVTSIFNGW